MIYLNFFFNILLFSGCVNDCNQSDFLCSRRTVKLQYAIFSHAILYHGQRLAASQCLVAARIMMLLLDKYFYIRKVK